MEGDGRVPYRTPFEMVFEAVPRLGRDAVFFNTRCQPSTDLARRVGSGACDRAGCTVDNKEQTTPVPGLYIAGDASRDVLQAIVAAAGGAQAAIGISTALLHEDLA